MASGPERRAFPWAWLVPSLLLLGGMTVWAVVRYPSLPDEVPRHIGPGGVDAWTAKSVPAVFLPVGIYAVVTVLVVAGAVAMARVTPLDELPPQDNPWQRAAATMSNRPATAAAAQRMARALLTMNALLGAGFLPPLWVQLRTERTAEVPWWVNAAMLVLFLASLVPVGVAWWRDASARRSRRTA